MSEWKRKFRKGFTGQSGDESQQSSDSPKLSYKERLAARMAKMSPEEKAERQRKIEAQRSYEDGGAVDCDSDKKNKLAVLAKLSKSKRK